MTGESTLSFLAWGPYPSTGHCRGQAVPKRFFASATGEADSNPGWMAKTLNWHLSLPPLSSSGTVWVPQVTPISGLRRLLARSSSATHLPVLPREGWAWAELGLGNFFTIRIYASSKIALGTPDQQAARLMGPTWGCSRLRRTWQLSPPRCGLVHTNQTCAPISFPHPKCLADEVFRGF